MSNDIIVRAYAKPIESKQPPPKADREEPKWPDHALVFDCESRITADQTLTFGFWRFCELCDNSYLSVEEGIFYNDEGLSAR
jgi:hypothetical protein